MAWESRKGKGKAAIFPAKLKTFVRDVTHRRRTSSDVKKTDVPGETTTEQKQQPWIISARPTTKHAGREYGLSVQVALKFEDPLDFSYNRTYHSSPNFIATETICSGLLRRIDHNLFELITRKDLTASASTEGVGKVKPMRYEMTIEISQGGSKWASRTYKSYQKEPLTADGAQEVMLSTHRMVGLFLRRHDPDFKLTNGAVRDEDASDGPETSPYRIGKIHAMNCIPRSRFLEKEQSFEMAPGFTIDLSIASNGQRRKPLEWRKTIEVNSSQAAPLNLATAEGLFADASCAVDSALRCRMRTIQTRHGDCTYVGGSCPHYHEKATKLHIRVRNNIGPEFDHLERTIDSKAVLLADPEGQESTDFIDTLEKALQGARDMADDTISKLKDLDFRVVELQGRGWTLDEPLVFTLDPTSSLSRRSIEAILDRVQTGVAEILRGNAISVRMTAVKRGHFILDKTLVAREPLAKGEFRRRISPAKVKAKVVAQLQRRIDEDIKMICKDTLSLDDMGEAEPPPTIIEEKPLGAPKEEEPAATAEVEADSGSSSDSDGETSLDRDEEETSEDGDTMPTESSAAEAENAPENSEEQVCASDVTPTVHVSEAPVMESRENEATDASGPMKALTDPQTGTRVFPLIPSPISEHGFEDFFNPSFIELDRIRRAALDTSSFRTTSVLGVQEAAQVHVPEQLEKKVEDTVETKDSEANEDQVPEAPTKPQDVPENKTTHNTRERNLSMASSGLTKGASDTDDQSSIAPPTPSLVIGDYSPRESVAVFTPRIQRSMSSAEVETVMARGPENDSLFTTPNATILVEDQQKFLKLMADDAEGLEVSKHRNTLAPRQLVATEKQDSEHVDPGQGKMEAAQESKSEPSRFETETPATTSSEAQIEPKRSEQTLRAKDGDTQPATPTSIVTFPVLEEQPEVDQKDADLKQDDHSRVAKIPLNEFAQTRSEFDEFDFSTPHTAESPVSPDEEVVDDEIARPGQAVTTNSSPARPSLTGTRARNKSFGSAGLLGFQGGNLFEVGLRQALMGSSNTASPRSPTSPFLQFPPLPRQRSVSPGILRRRPASSGRELQMASSVGAASLKRSVSSDTLREKRSHHHHHHHNHHHHHQDVSHRGRGKEGEQRERRPSMLFLVAGVTLASQVLRGQT